MSTISPLSSSPEQDHSWERRVERILNAFQRDYMVIGKRHVRFWHAWLAIGLATGVATGVILVANRSGEVEPSKAEEPTRTSVELIGPPEVVFDWSAQHCPDEETDIPDTAARAFRDADGKINLLSTHHITRRFIGDALDTVKHTCEKNFISAEDSVFGNYRYREFIHSLYTPDGSTVYGLIHNEWYAHLTYPSCSKADQSGWVNSITAVISTDKGATYGHQQNYKVVSTPPWQPEFSCSDDKPTVYGSFNPSNIIEKDGYFYSLYMYGTSPAVRPRVGGTCLMRTQHLDLASSWEIWTKDAWKPASGNVCAPLAGIETMHESITYNTYLKSYVLVGTKYHPKQGLFFATSQDLIHWSRPIEIPWDQAWGTWAYPSLLDPVVDEGQTRNFERSDQEAYIYYTRFNDVTSGGPTLDRDLIRQKVRFTSPQEKPIPASITPTIKTILIYPNPMNPGEYVTVTIIGSGFGAEMGTIVDAYRIPGTTADTEDLLVGSVPGRRDITWSDTRVTLRVYPSVTSGYTPGTYTDKISIIDSQGKRSNPFEITSTVTSTPTTPTILSIGDRIKTLSPVEVRQTPLPSATTLGTQPFQAQGTIKEGPQFSSHSTWWNIDFQTGVDGWVSESFLQKVVAPTSNPSITLAAMLPNPGIKGKPITITITGSNFGAIPGKVEFFAPTGSQKILPDISTSVPNRWTVVWTNSLITITLLPQETSMYSIGRAITKVKVTNSAPLPSNFFPLPYEIADAKPADIKANGQDQLTITKGQTATLTWTSSGFDTCTVSPGAYKGAQSPQGGIKTPPITITTPYVLTCIQGTRTSVDTVVITVGTPSP